jgi:hypothetical protein
MGFKITDYPAKVGFDDGDLMDVSSYDGVSTYTSEKMLYSDLKSNLNSSLNFLTSVDLSYTASTRTVGNTGGNDAVLPLFTDVDAGLVPLSGGGTTNFLRADGTWAAAGGADNLGNHTATESLKMATFDIENAGRIGFDDRIAHKDKVASNFDFALLQNSSGLTWLNATSGQKLRFGTGGTLGGLIANISSSGLSVANGDTAATEALDVGGNVYIDGGIKLPNAGVPGVGKVLTSDGIGNGTWADALIDGNGIFDATNDGGIVPTSFDINLTDNLNFDSNTLYIDGANNRVGIGTVGTVGNALTVQGATRVNGKIERTSTDFKGIINHRDSNGLQDASVISYELNNSIGEQIDYAIAGAYIQDATDGSEVGWFGIRAREASDTSLTGIPYDVIVKGGGVFNVANMPTSSAGLSTGDMFTQTATELGGSGTTKVVCIV